VINESIFKANLLEPIFHEGKVGRLNTSFLVPVSIVGPSSNEQTAVVSHVRIIVKIWFDIVLADAFSERIADA